jgi:hypothetical protein
LGGLWRGYVGYRDRDREGRSIIVDYGEQTTGTRDEHYNLISVLYHALHGAENCDRYAADAEISGDERLAAFFRETQTMQTQIAERAKGLLGILEPPPEFGVEPGTVSGGVPPETPGYRVNDVPSTTEVPRTPPRGTPGDAERGTISDAPIVTPGEGVPPYVASPPGLEERSPREEPPLGEERPERRGAVPPPTPREEPPAGEKRPGRRMP